MYGGGGGGGGSLPLGELIQRICSASGERARGLIGTVCHTIALKRTHTPTSQALPTAECMSTPGPKSELQ